MKHTCSILVACLSAVAGLAGCRGDREDAPPRQFFPDMDDQPKWREQSKSGFYADGRTMRRPVEGTVPFGRVAWQSESEWAESWMNERNQMLGDDEIVKTGVDAEGTYVANIPVAVTAEMISLGKQQYDINCSVCHGYDGDGKGMVGLQWSIPVPGYHETKYKDRAEETGRDGYLFHVIRNGVRTMPAYAHTLSVSEAWAVVAYVRVLQETREGTLSDVPEQQRARIEQLMGAAAATPATDPAPAEPAPAPKAPETPAAPGGAK